MAKRGSDPGGAPDKAKVRIFFAEVEGDNDSIREAIRTMAQSMNRPIVQAPPRGSIASNGAQARPVLLDEEEPPVEMVEGGTSDTDEMTEAPAPARKRGTGPKRDHNTGIELVPNMDFWPRGHPPLKDFFAEKTPGTDGEQTLVVMYYMQHMMGLAGMGYGHIRTAFRDVNKPLPVDLRSTVRHLKKQKPWITGTSDKLQVTTQGANCVEHELPVTKAAK